MKFVLCVVAAIAALQYVTCYDYAATEDSEELVNQLNMRGLRDSIRQKAALEQVKNRINAVCPGYGSKFENVTMEIAACADQVDEADETMCSIVRNHVKRCLRPLTNMFEECLPSQAKQLPGMAVDMIITTSNHLCRTDGEHIFELGNTCVKNINPKTTRCVRRISAKFQQYERKESMPSAQDLCEVFESLRPCLQSHLNAACGHPITRESFLSFFDEAMKVCKNYEKNEIELVEIDSN